MNGIKKALGGLTKEYYIRQFLFGLIFPVLMYFMLSQSKQVTSLAMIGPMVFWAISSLLYPYSRFVYESIVEYIMGNNVFFTSIPLMLFTKFFTMLLCWAFAILVAPIGLLYLYYYHSKEENIVESSDDLN